MGTGQNVSSIQKKRNTKATLHAKSFQSFQINDVRMSYYDVIMTLHLVEFCAHKRSAFYQEYLDPF